MPDALSALCIIADVKSSRAVDKKNELREITEIINSKVESRLITPFSVRNGDELFGILNTYSDGYHVLKELFMLSEEKSTPLYVGIGLGFITDEDLNNPHEVNGSSIWHASSALSNLKNKKNRIQPPNSASKTFSWQVKATSSIPYESLNYHIYYLFERLMKRTDKQREVVQAVEELNDSNNYTEIGQKLGIDNNIAVNISKTLARADYHLVADAERSLCLLLDYFQQQLIINLERGERY